MYTKTSKPLPAGNTQGRPSIFNLHNLAIGDGLDIRVPDADRLRSVRGSLFSSAHHRGIKIKTQYSKASGILTAWRIA